MKYKLLILIFIGVFLLSFVNAEENNKTKVLCFGDSITQNFNPQGGAYCNILAFLRPDIEVTIKGMPGEGTIDGAERLKKILKESGKGYYDYILIIEGVNDNAPWNIEKYGNSTPEETAKRLRTMAQKSGRYINKKTFILNFPIYQIGVGWNPYQKEYISILEKYDIEKHSLPHRKFYYADMYNFIKLIYHTEELTYDLVHPNILGRIRMAQYV